VSTRPEYQEIYKGIPKTALKRVKSRIPHERKTEYSIRALSIYDNVFIDDEYVEHPLSELIQFCIGNAVVCGCKGSLEDVFRKILTDVDENDFNKRNIVFTNGELWIDDDWFTLSLKLGGKWGYLNAFKDDCCDSKLMLDEAKEKIELMIGIGWDFDGIFRSPQRMGAELLKRTLEFYPNVGASDYKYIEIAWNCFKGGRMEANKLGTFHNVKSYDDNAAYLSKLRIMPSLSSGKFIESTDYIENALLGYCYVDFTTYNGNIATRFESKGIGHRLFFPVGRREGFLTKSEIDYVVQSGNGKIHQIIYGAWFVPNGGFVSYPFEKVCVILQKALKIEKLRPMAKLISSMIWGKFITDTGSLLFNPFYASEITALERISLATLIDRLPEGSLIAATQDGVETDRDIPGIVLGDNIGELKRCTRETMISVSDYFRFISSELHSWSLINNGASVPDGNGGYATLPFGSAKKQTKQESNYTLTSLSEQHLLSSPTIDKCRMIMISRRDEVAFLHKDVEGDIWQ